jgi:hypothetical protein
MTAIHVRGRRNEDHEPREVTSEMMIMMIAVMMTVMMMMMMIPK